MYFNSNYIRKTNLAGQLNIKRRTIKRQTGLFKKKNELNMWQQRKMTRKTRD